MGRVLAGGEWGLGTLKSINTGFLGYSLNYYRIGFT